MNPPTFLRLQGQSRTFRVRQLQEFPGFVSGVVDTEGQFWAEIFRQVIRSGEPVEWVGESVAVSGFLDEVYIDAKGQSVKFTLVRVDALAHA